MPAKTTTQKLDVRWQDRTWQPRIRLATAGAGRSVGSLIESRLKVATPGAAGRPCRQRRSSASLVRHLILALRPRRRKQT